MNMIEERKQVKLKKITLFIMGVLGIIFYFGLGEWISMESDTPAYLYEQGREGVLPGYPTFIAFFRFLLGADYYLHGVVVAQSILAIVCTMIFVVVLQRQFQITNVESVFLYIVTMLPFSIYLPEVGITHQILTEGITYSLFYLYFILVLKAMWEKKYRWYLACLLGAIIMGLIRSQMLFLQVICFGVLLWITWHRANKRVLGCFVALILGAVLAFGSYKTIYGVIAFDRQVWKEKDDEKNKALKIAAAEERGEEYVEIPIEEMPPEEQEWYRIHELDSQETTSQITALIASRGIFEADEEDYLLFEDEIVRDIFIKVYKIADDKGQLHSHAKKGLYMWEDLVHDEMMQNINIAVEEYDKENVGKRNISTASLGRILGGTLLIHHFDRYVYHCIRLMIPSFIASVFFQIRPIYLLCHFIALFIYLFAIGGIVWLRKNGGNRQLIEYITGIVVTLIFMVIIVNLVFTGLQRYVVYGMGIFWCGMYLQIKEMWLLLRKKNNI